MIDPQNTLLVALVQTDVVWHDPVANRASLEEKMWGLKDKAHLIVLPEMFTTGFTKEVTPYAEMLRQDTFKWMKQMAEQTQAVITGSYLVKEGGKVYNRLIWMRPDGTHHHYDKKHLFTLADEHQVMSAGHEKGIVELHGWKFRTQICYDLRFPVWLRNVEQEYDVLLFVASWPMSRSIAWNTLLAARAIENNSYVIGVNRIGEDGNGLRYSGDSQVIFPTGDILGHSMDNEEIMIVALFKQELIDHRNKFPVHLDADRFKILD